MYVKFKISPRSVTYRSLLPSKLIYTPFSYVAALLWTALVHSYGDVERGKASLVSCHSFS